MGAVFPLKGSLSSKDHFADALNQHETRLDDVEADVTTLTTLEAWVAPTLQNSWVNYGGDYNAIGYWKDPFGIVHLRGMAKDGTVGAGTPVFTLPSGYRPSPLRAKFASISNGAFAHIEVKNTGEVDVVSGNNTYVSLDGITFRTS